MRPWNKINWNEEDKKKIIDYYTKEKLSMEEIGRRFNCSAPTIKKILKGNNIKLRTLSETLKGKKAWNKIKFNKEEKERIIDLYTNKNLSITEIMKQLNCPTFKAIKRELKENNIKIKSLSEIKKGKPNPKVSKTLKELYKKGEIASWCKDLKGEEYLKHFKEGKTWNKDLKGKDVLRHYKNGKMWNKLDLNNKEIKRLYVEEKKSSYQISKVFNCSNVTILNRLRQMKIPLRKAWDYPRTYLKFTDEHRKNLGKSVTQSYVNDPELRKIRSRNSKAYQERFKKTKEYPLFVEKFVQRTKQDWKENREKCLKRLFKGRCPNKAEIKLNNMLQENFPKEWKFVGNGYTFIAGRCPDFLNVNGKKKVIELFGEYYHSPLLNQKVIWDKTYNETIKHYKKYGFDCLVVWWSELKNPDKVIEKVGNFIQ